MCLSQWIGLNLSNIIAFIAFIISMISLVFAIKKYKMQLPSLRKITQSGLDSSKGKEYLARITLQDVDQQITIIKSRVLRKKIIFYKEVPNWKLLIRAYKNDKAIANSTITGYGDIVLNEIANFEAGKYKLILYIDRYPNKLKLKFMIPFNPA